MADPVSPPPPLSDEIEEAKSLNRRKFIKNVCLGGLISGAAVSLSLVTYETGFKKFQATTDDAARPLTFDFRVSSDKVNKTVCQIKGKNPLLMIEAGIAALGGLENFIQKGDVVAIKPNIGWDRLPEHAANTNPELISALVKLCFKAGAKSVLVSDNSCNEPRRCFIRSGIGAAAQAAGAEVILPQQHLFRKLQLNGTVLKEWPVLYPLLQVNKFINVPIVKHHSLTQVTIGLKNLYGMLGGSNRYHLHQDIHQSILDLGMFIRPTLTIVDAIRVLTKGGPQGGNLDDVLELNTLVMTTDPVAADACGAALLKRSKDKLPFIRMAHGILGDMNYDQEGRLKIIEL